MDQHDAGIFTEQDDRPADRLHRDHVDLCRLDIRADLGTRQPYGRQAQDEPGKTEAVLQEYLHVALRRAVAQQGERQQEDAQEQQDQEQTEDVGPDS